MAKGIAGFVAFAILVAFLVVMAPKVRDYEKNQCEAQGGQYIYWRNDGHCYPAYSIPVTPTRGR